MLNRAYISIGKGEEIKKVEIVRFKVWKDVK